MSSELAIPDSPAGVEVAQQRADAAIGRLGEWARSAEAAHSVATRLVQTSFVPDGFRGKPMEATAAILAGAEVGLSPMGSLRSFDVIQGTAAPRAATLRAIVQSFGHEIRVVESTETRAIVEGRRRGEASWQKSTWTLDRAKKAGLTGKANWRNQPQAMLVARATSECARLIAMDAILGIAYSAEELFDDAEPDAPPEPQGNGRKRRTLKRAPVDAPKTQPKDEPVEAEVVEPDEPSLEDPTDLDDTPDEPPAEEAEHRDTGSWKATEPQRKRLFALLKDAGLDSEQDRHTLVGLATDWRVTSSSDLTRDEYEQAAIIAELIGAGAVSINEDGPDGDPVLLKRNGDPQPVPIDVAKARAFLDGGA